MYAVTLLYSSSSTYRNTLSLTLAFPFNPFAFCHCSTHYASYPTGAVGSHQRPQNAEYVALRVLNTKAHMHADVVRVQHGGRDHTKLKNKTTVAETGLL